jgi:preprotein translocase subunit SecG
MEILKWFIITLIVLFGICSIFLQWGKTDRNHKEKKLLRDLNKYLRKEEKK